LEHVEYDIAVMTNITGDHLDFHETFDAYRAAKTRLFEMLDRPSHKAVAKTAIVNADDPSAEHCLRHTRATPLRFALESPEVDVRAEALVLRSDGSDFRLITPLGTANVSLAIPAFFNVSNALAAASVGVGLGFAPQVVAAGLAACRGVPGRMERIAAGQPFEVIVDYAHTGDALRKILQVLRAVTRGRLIVVVGAAGDRDPGRRFGVGRAAAEGADFAVFTSEDPRSEVPGAIVAEIGRHAADAGRVAFRDFVEIEDRREAIGHALGAAKEGDVVAICGKGHERSIIYGETTLPWDDRVVALEELARLGFSGR
jgi:UDP-N-acetylmuramoyl-L-alanyl-D-glutamate--2,6-diaminopimelate ligase